MRYSVIRVRNRGDSNKCICMEQDFSFILFLKLNLIITGLSSILLLKMPSGIQPNLPCKTG